MSPIDPASQAILEDVLRRESRSLLCYVGDAYPWTTTAGEPGLKALNQVIRQEKDAIVDLGRHLVRRKVKPPFIGSYPASFTSWNFIDLNALLPRLVESHERLINELKADLSKILDQAAKQEAERLLSVKKMTHEVLRRLLTPESASA